jgi:hypothetical protein
MKKSWLAVAFALAFSAHSQLALSQITSNATGGAGGQGGAAQGGTATGGTAIGGTATGGAASNSNTVTTSGGSGGTGGTSSAQGGNASAQGGTATGIQTGPISGTGNNQAADVTVNYIQPSAPGGIKGLAAGVDPNTNAIVYDNNNNITYSGTYKVKNTPDVSVGGPASGPCNGFSGGVGMSVPGFALGANASTVDKGCEARETARVAAMLGRMDIANAVLEHISVVEEALKAKAARDAAAKQAAAMAAPVTPARAAPAAQPNLSESEIEVARLQEQQRLAVAALQRNATMNKIYDNLTFTNAANQASEKTPQQVMAEQTIKEQAEKAARLEQQQQLERQLVALKSAPADKPLNALAPEVPVPKLALAKAAAVTAVAATPQVQAPVANAQNRPQEIAAAAANEQPKPANQAQPRALSVDKVADLLGFGSAPNLAGPSAPSPQVASDTPQKSASETVIAQQNTKRVATADKKGADAGSKASAATADSVNAAKGLLNFK